VEHTDFFLGYANVVTESVCIAAGLIKPLGSCSTTCHLSSDPLHGHNPRYDAVLNKNHYIVDGDTLYIGTRGSGEPLITKLLMQARGPCYRAKKRDNSHVRGFDEEGPHLLCVAGTRDNSRAWLNWNSTFGFSAANTVLPRS
jgi:hypothetical protein